MFVCYVFLYCYRFVKFCGKTFVTFCKMGATRPPETPSLFSFLFFSRLEGLFQLKKKTVPAVVCVCAFILKYNFSPLFVLNRSGTTTEKEKKTQKNMTDQLAILQSLLLHLTGTGLPPATSLLRGEERWEEKGGAKGGTSLHIKSDFKKTKHKKSTLGPFFFFLFFSFFTVLK